LTNVVFLLKEKLPKVQFCNSLNLSDSIYEFDQQVFLLFYKVIRI